MLIAQVRGARLHFVDISVPQLMTWRVMTPTWYPHYVPEHVPSPKLLSGHSTPPHGRRTMRWRRRLLTPKSQAARRRRRSRCQDAAAASPQRLPRLGRLARQPGARRQPAGAWPSAYEAVPSAAACGIAHGSRARTPPHGTGACRQLGLSQHPGRASDWVMPLQQPGLCSGQAQHEDNIPAAGARAGAGQHHPGR